MKRGKGEEKEWNAGWRERVKGKRLRETQLTTNLIRDCKFII